MRNTLRELGQFGGAALAVAAVTGAAYLLTASSIEKGDCEVVEVSVFFSSGEARLSAAAQDILLTAANSLEGCNLELIEAHGYADMGGSPETNMAISEDRARAVLSFVERLRLEADAIRIVGHGDEGAVDSRGQPAIMRRKTDVRFVPEGMGESEAQDA